MDVREFQQLIVKKAEELYRDLPWRREPTPYHVLVSELMLQQTQVERVVPKFEVFMEKFPSIEALAVAPLADVLVAWQGLGYNRRAKYLHQAAQQIIALPSFPATIDELTTLPGVGPNTAGAIMAYAFDQPVVYIETNIRTVYLHHFFVNRYDMSDQEILAKLHKTTPFLQGDSSVSPRVWYSALMDYGTELKRQGYGKIIRSRHYVKQSKFDGSLRQMRGRILRELARGEQAELSLRRIFADDARYPAARNGLVRDGLVTQEDGTLRLQR